jgi:hypothetical protein
MNEAERNPASNRLGAGVADETLRQAVESSGYPLQTIVAVKLSSADFVITEEWVFTDNDTGQLRALDLHASHPLYDWRGHSNPRVRPSVSLLIECKRSEMPYIFFASDSRPGRGGFATNDAGLLQDEINVRTDDDVSTWGFTTLQALGLADHPFLADPPRVAMTFSKVARRGKELALSGTDPYQSLVLPLTKALRGYASRIAPPKTAVYFDLVLPLAVAVIDGPMVVASVAQSGVSYELHPWVRVYRHDVDIAAADRPSEKSCTRLIASTAIGSRSTS